MGSLPETTQAAEMLLFDFERPSQALRWRAVNDVVMGGVSKWWLPGGVAYLWSFTYG